jgi:hypothetical protein
MVIVILIPRSVLSQFMTKNKIYESPDGGKTIREREFGEVSIHSKLFRRRGNWDTIIYKCETDEALNEMVEKVEVYFELKYKGDYRG